MGMFIFRLNSIFTGDHNTLNDTSPIVNDLGSTNPDTNSKLEHSQESLNNETSQTDVNTSPELGNSEFNGNVHSEDDQKKIKEYSARYNPWAILQPPPELDDSEFNGNVHSEDDQKKIKEYRAYIEEECKKMEPEFEKLTTEVVGDIKKKAEKFKEIKDPAEQEKFLTELEKFVLKKDESVTKKREPWLEKLDNKKKEYPEHLEADLEAIKTRVIKKMDKK